MNSPNEPGGVCPSRTDGVHCVCTCCSCGQRPFPAAPTTKPEAVEAIAQRFCTAPDCVDGRIWSSPLQAHRDCPICVDFAQALTAHGNSVRLDTDDELDSLRWKLTDRALDSDEGKYIMLEEFHEVWIEHLKGGK